MTGACDACLRRTDLIAGLSGCLEVEWRRRGAPSRVLALHDEALLALDATGTAARRHAAFSPVAARKGIAAAGLTALCRCDPGYPDRLRELDDPPAVLHVLGDPRVLARRPAVAVVGARRASAYGLEVARGLGRGVSAAGVAVVSGMALGVDSAAHAGALEAAGPTIAVLAGSADVPYPARARALHARIRTRGCVVSELPPGARAQRWTFVARNRTIAALGDATVLVEAAERSGSLTTADFALGLGRQVGAVPGPVTSSRSDGTNALLQAGAAVVRGVADALDLVGLAAPPSAPGHPGSPGTAPGAASARPGDAAAASDLPSALRTLLAAIEDGRCTLPDLARTAEEARTVLGQLAELEFLGLVRRTSGGRYLRAL